MKPDWRAFDFPPGRTIFEWVSSNNTEWSVMKINNRNGGIYDVGDYKDIGINDRSCRLVVIPTADLGEASMDLVAIARPKGDLENLQGNVEGDASAGYPVVLFGKFRAAFGGQLDEPHRDGLSHYPVLVNRYTPGRLSPPNN